jgi:hypothetical protein
MKLTSFFCLLSITALGFVYAPDANACACCSDPGQRVESTAKMTAYEKGEIEKMVFTKKTKLAPTPAGPQGMPESVDPSDLTVTRVADRWTLTFKDPKTGKTGALSFNLPDTLESFFIDQYDGKPNVDPLLYKEWRFNAPLVSTTGMFASSASKPGAAAPTIRVVFHGAGNSCSDVDQFSRYTIVVSGPNARFTFFGALAKPAASVTISPAAKP